MSNTNNNETPGWVKNLLEEEELFWNQKYPQLSQLEKIKHWSATLHKQMRSNAESGYDPYAIYSPQRLSEIKQVEKDFTEFLEVIFETFWKGQWDHSEIKKRLGL